MSKVQVDSIVNKNDDGAPNFPKGVTITTGVNVVGVVTANDYDGNFALDCYLFN